LFAWLLYEDDGAERAVLRATAGMMMLAIAVFSIIMPWLRPVFPSVTLARVLHDAGCAHPLAASAGYEEPSLVFLAGTETRLTDAANAADFLNGGACRFAFVESRQERAFARRADAIGLQYTRGLRVDGYNVSTGRPISIAVFASAGAP
jgi:hypothetical protein